MDKRCYYKILGVSRGSSDDEIKKAFRRQAKSHHPDRNPDDPEAERRFVEVNEAYDVLSDPQKRAAYDRFGHAAFEGGGAGAAGAHGFGADFSSSMSDIFDDLFGEFMGGRQARRRRGRERGGDLRYNMEITLADAYFGKRAEIRVPTSISCESCTGTGSAGGARPASCSTCGGVGRVRASQGFFTIERTCPHCHGAGEVVENPCADCSGTGRQTRERTLSVEIPPGVEDGTRIRLAGEGEAGLRGGPPGDLYIFLSIEPDELFQRDGADLFCRVPIQMTTAALGGQIEVPTINGESAQIRIPEGTAAGHEFRVHGQGMPVLRSKATGDLYVQVEVETPKNLTRKQKELLREFEKASTQKTSPEATGFLSRVKAFWERVGDT
ncbi:MAG: molecular chaperone DnaJ, partial [Dichotomicrobium sp.]